VTTAKRPDKSILLGMGVSAVAVIPGPAESRSPESITPGRAIRKGS
jgi:hypothetical protein